MEHNEKVRSLRLLFRRNSTHHVNVMFSFLKNSPFRLGRHPSGEICESKCPGSELPEMMLLHSPDPRPRARTPGPPPRSRPSTNNELATDWRGEMHDEQREPTPPTSSTEKCERGYTRLHVMYLGTLTQ
jgi:hypothetical protein